MIEILGSEFDGKQISADAFQSWCEDSDTDCSFQHAWNEWAGKHGEPQVDNKVLMDLITSAIAFGANAALIEVSDHEWHLEKSSEAVNGECE